MRTRSSFLFALPLALLVVGVGTPAQAKLPWVKKAQGMGFAEIKNCQSCHTTATPKKGDPQLAERGKWLMDEKNKRKASEVDLAWLKDYKGK